MIYLFTRAYFFSYKEHDESLFTGLCWITKGAKHNINL